MSTRQTTVQNKDNAIDKNSDDESDQSSSDEQSGTSSPEIVSSKITKNQTTEVPKKNNMEKEPEDPENTIPVHLREEKDDEEDADDEGECSDNVFSGTEEPDNSNSDDQSEGFDNTPVDVLTVSEENNKEEIPESSYHKKAEFSGLIPTRPIKLTLFLKLLMCFCF